jgi:hypothetical protein
MRSTLLLTILVKINCYCGLNKYGRIINKPMNLHCSSTELTSSLTTEPKLIPEREILKIFGRLADNYILLDIEGAGFYFKRILLSVFITL